MKNSARDIIAMACRRAHKGSGTASHVVREAGVDYDGADVGAYLRNVSYLLVGGMASSIYMQPRATLDTDALVSLEELKAAEEGLLAAGCRKTGNLSIGGSTWITPSGEVLDLIALDAPWIEQAMTQPVIGPRGIRFIALPYLVLMKLLSARLQDLADISRMLGVAADEDVEKVLQAVREYSPQDEEDVHSMLRLGRLELAD
jgi:hypothetical protein